MSATFIHKLYDWADFEEFVKNLYCQEGDVLVERNVAVVGKSGARRQIDVKISQRSMLHTYITVVECKRWKEPVTRDVIDIVAAAVDDIGASKGVVFTTKGYVQGAKDYASTKNIDLFVIRDLTGVEWGRKGRVVNLFLHGCAGEFSQISMPGALMTPLVEQYPSEIKIDFAVTPENLLCPDFDLFSVKDGMRGPNINSLLVDVHAELLRKICRNIGILTTKGDSATMSMVADCNVDLSDFSFRQLRIQYGAVNLKSLKFKFLAQIHQGEIRIDLGEALDLALVVENYLTAERYIATKSIGEEEIDFRPLQAHKVTANSDSAKNQTIIKAFMSPWMRPQFDENDVLTSIPAILVIVQKNNRRMQIEAKWASED